MLTYSVRTRVLAGAFVLCAALTVLCAFSIRFVNSTFLVLLALLALAVLDRWVTNKEQGKSAVHELANQNPFALLGYVTFFVAALLFAAFAMNLRARLIHHAARDLSFWGLLAAYAALTGWGLIRLRKWAVVLFVGPSCVVGGILVVGSVIEVPLPWTLINIAFGLMLCSTAVMAVRNWRDLS